MHQIISEILGINVPSLDQESGRDIITLLETVAGRFAFSVIPSPCNLSVFLCMLTLYLYTM